MNHAEHPVSVRSISARTIIAAVKNGPDPYFGGRYNINLYRGCPHGCIYCDTRSACYGVGNLNDIRVKENALDILEGELRSKRRKGTVTTGSMNDPYMPVEGELRLTRSALKLMAEHGFGAHVITKSDLVTRDMDVLKRVGRVYVAVSLTITTTDSGLANIIEPRAPSPERRLLALRRLAQGGVYAGVTIMPVLPFLTDNEETIRAIVVQAAAHGAQYVRLFPALSLRDACREHYYAALDSHFPGLRKRYIRMYGDQYWCAPPNARRLMAVFKNFCKDAGMSPSMKFYNASRERHLSLWE